MKLSSIVLKKVFEMTIAEKSFVDDSEFFPQGISDHPPFVNEDAEGERRRFPLETNQIWLWKAFSILIESLFSKVTWIK